MHGHQKKTLAFFVLGIVLSGSAVMQRVAETLSERGLTEAKMSSIERRLARFIANKRIVVPLIGEALFSASLCAVSWPAAALRAGQHALSGRSDDCVSGTAGAFAGVASGLGRDASADEMRRGPMGHRRTAVGSGECPSARHVLYSDG